MEVKGESWNLGCDHGDAYPHGSHLPSLDFILYMKGEKFELKEWDYHP